MIILNLWICLQMKEQMIQETTAHLEAEQSHSALLLRVKEMERVVERERRQVNRRKWLEKVHIMFFSLSDKYTWVPISVLQSWMNLNHVCCWEEAVCDIQIKTFIICLIKVFCPLFAGVLSGGGSSSRLSCLTYWWTGKQGGAKEEGGANSRPGKRVSGTSRPIGSETLNYGTF